MNAKKAFALIAANTLNSKKWKPTTLSRGAKAEQRLQTTAKCYAVSVTDERVVNRWDVAPDGRNRRIA